MARTILDEALGFRLDVIEHQLVHAMRGFQWPGLQPDGVPARATPHDASLGRLPGRPSDRGDRTRGSHGTAAHPQLTFTWDT